MSIFNKIGNAVSNGVHNTVDHLQHAGKAVAHSAENVGKAVAHGAENVGKAVAHGAHEVGEAAVRTATYTAQTVRHQAAVVRAGLEKTVDGIARFGSNVIQKFKSIAGQVAVNAIGSAHPKDAQGMSFAETKGASSLAYDAKKDEIYQFPDGKQWKVDDVAEDKKSGFRAISLKSLDPNDKRTIVAYAGTNPKSLKDWKTDVAQEFGFQTRQYTLADEFAKKVMAKDGDNVILTGHSLGGGLASYASIQNGLRATGLNSAPLSPHSLGGNPVFDRNLKNNPRISQYYVPSEILTDVDKLNPFSIRPGEQIPIRGKYPTITMPGLPDLIFSGLNHTTGNCVPDVPLPKKLN